MRPPAWSAVVMALLFVLSAYTVFDPTISRARLALHLVFMVFITVALGWYFYAGRGQR